jgi:hypothetical protein
MVTFVNFKILFIVNKINYICYLNIVIQALGLFVCLFDGV